MSWSLLVIYSLVKVRYLAGTDPNNINSVLRITAESFTSGGTIASLTWDSEPTRLYYILGSTNLATATWLDSGWFDHNGRFHGPESAREILPCAGGTAAHTVSLQNLKRPE